MADQEGSFTEKTADPANRQELDTRGCDLADAGGEAVVWNQL